MADKFLHELSEDKRLEDEARKAGHRLVLPQELGMWLPHDSPERYRRVWKKPATTDLWEKLAQEYYATHSPKNQSQESTHQHVNTGSHGLHVSVADQHGVRLEPIPNKATKISL